MSNGYNIWHCYMILHDKLGSNLIRIECQNSPLTSYSNMCYIKGVVLYARQSLKWTQAIKVPQFIISRLMLQAEVLQLPANFTRIMLLFTTSCPYSFTCMVSAGPRLLKVPGPDRKLDLTNLLF